MFLSTCTGIWQKGKIAITLNLWLFFSPLLLAEHRVHRSYWLLHSPLTDHCMPFSISFSFMLAPGRALCAILDYIQFYARPWQSLVCHPRLHSIYSRPWQYLECHPRSHSVLFSPLAELCVPSSITCSFMLPTGRTLCVILDYIQLFAHPWQSLECHPRSHSVLFSPLAELCVPSSTLLSFMLAPGRALCAILDYIQFFARPW